MSGGSSSSCPASSSRAAGSQTFAADRPDADASGALGKRKERTGSTLDGQAAEPSGGARDPFNELAERCREAGILDDLERPLLESVAAIEAAHQTAQWKRDKRKMLRRQVLRAVEHAEQQQQQRLQQERQLGQQPAPLESSQQTTSMTTSQQHANQQDSEQDGLDTFEGSEIADSEPCEPTDYDLYEFEQYVEAEKRRAMRSLLSRVTAHTPWREGVALVSTTEAQQSGTNVVLLDDGRLAVHSTDASEGWPWCKFGRRNEPLQAATLCSTLVHDSRVEREFTSHVFVQQAHVDARLPLVGVSGKLSARVMLAWIAPLKLTLALILASAGVLSGLWRYGSWKGQPFTVEWGVMLDPHTGIFYAEEDRLYDSDDVRQWPLPGRWVEEPSEPGVQPVRLMGCPVRPPFLVRIHVDLTRRQLAFAIDDHPLQPITSPIPVAHLQLDECESFTARSTVRFSRVFRRCLFTERSYQCSAFSCHCSAVPMADATIAQLLSPNDRFDYKHIQLADWEIGSPQLPWQ